MTSSRQTPCVSAGFRAFTVTGCSFIWVTVGSCVAAEMETLLPDVLLRCASAGYCQYVVIALLFVVVNVAVWRCWMSFWLQQSYWWHMCRVYCHWKIINLTQVRLQRCCLNHLVPVEIAFICLIWSPQVQIYWSSGCCWVVEEGVADCICLWIECWSFIFSFSGLLCGSVQRLFPTSDNNRRLELNQTNSTNLQGIN